MPSSTAPPRKPRKRELDAVLDAVKSESTFNLNEVSEVARAAAAVDLSIGKNIVKAINSGDFSADETIRLIRVLEVICPKPALLVHLLEVVNADSRVRSKVALSVGRLVQNAVWLREQLADPDPIRRATAVQALSTVELEGSEELLIMATYDPDPKVVANAALALRRLGRLESIKVCQSLLRHEDRAFRSAGLWTADQMGDPRFLTILNDPTAAHWDASEQEMRAKVVEALEDRLSNARFAGRLQMQAISSRTESGTKITVAVSCVPFEQHKAVDFIVEEDGILVNSVECKLLEVNEPLTACILIPEGISLRAELLARQAALKNPETLSCTPYRSAHEVFASSVASLKAVKGAKHLFLVAVKKSPFSLSPALVKTIRQNRIHVHTLIAEDAPEEIAAALNHLSLETGGMFSKAGSAQDVANQLQSVRAQHAGISELSWRCKTEKPAEIRIRCVTGSGYGELTLSGLGSEPRY